MKPVCCLPLPVLQMDLSALSVEVCPNHTLWAGLGKDGKAVDVFVCLFLVSLCLAWLCPLPFSTNINRRLPPELLDIVSAWFWQEKQSYRASCITVSKQHKPAPSLSLILLLVAFSAHTMSGVGNNQQITSSSSSWGRLCGGKDTDCKNMWRKEAFEQMLEMTRLLAAMQILVVLS